MVEFGAACRQAPQNCRILYFNPADRERRERSEVLDGLFGLLPAGEHPRRGLDPGREVEPPALLRRGRDAEALGAVSMLADVCQGLPDPVQWVLDHSSHPFRDDRVCLSAVGAPLPVDPYGDEHPFLLLQMPLPPPVPIETPGAVGAWNVAELITIWVFPLVRHLKNIPF